MDSRDVKVVSSIYVPEDTIWFQDNQLFTAPKNYETINHILMRTYEIKGLMKYYQPVSQKEYVTSWFGGINNAYRP